MGIFKDLRSISTQAKALNATTDPGAQLREMNAKMRGMNDAFVQATPSGGLPVAVAQATVSIVAVRPTNTMVHTAPVVELDVLVMRPGRPPVPVTTNMCVPSMHVHRVQPGANLAARIDATDPRVFAFDWQA